MTKYTAIKAVELMLLEFERAPYVVEGMVTSGSAILLTGREKSGKGWFCLDLAVCVASDRPFLGRSVTQGPVIYLSLEEHARTLQDRLRLHGDLSGVPLHFVRLDGSDDGRKFELESPDDIDGLGELIEEIGPVLVIIDTLREAHSGREDHSDDMSPRLRPIRQTAHQTNTAIVVTHHANKNAGTFRGSTSIRAAFDDEIAFTRLDDQNDTNIRASVKVEGRNVAKDIVHVEFDAAKGSWRENGAIVSNPEPSLRDRMLGCLKGQPDGLTAHEIADRLKGTSLKTVQNQIPLLKELITPRGEGRRGDPRRYVLTNPEMELVTVPDSSGNSSNISEFPRKQAASPAPQCVHCGKPRTAGSLYCAAHTNVKATGTEGRRFRDVDDL